MILQAETLLEYGYLPMDLKPKSSKPILAACDDCSKVRETTRSAYRSLCISCTEKGKILSEETKALMSAAMKGHKNALGHIHTKEAKAKIRKGHKGKIHSEETKALMRRNHADFKGKNHPRWLGGISYGLYCEKFNEAYKQLIRNRFNNRCFWCNITTEENGVALSVHHVNYNKNCGCDETKCICVPLCIRCHMKSNYDRDGWQEKIMKKLELSGIQIED